MRDDVLERLVKDRVKPVFVSKNTTPSSRSVHRGEQGTEVVRQERGAGERVCPWGMPLFAIFHREGLQLSWKVGICP